MNFIRIKKLTGNEIYDVIFQTKEVIRFYDYLSRYLTLIVFKKNI